MHFSVCIIAGLIYYAAFFLTNDCQVTDGNIRERLHANDIFLFNSIKIP